MLRSSIIGQYPAFTVQAVADGNPVVIVAIVAKRPGLADARVDVDAIALFCRREPKDFNHATDQMLRELNALKKQ